MSLPRGQERVLDAMAAGLQATEPRLAAMFAMFARLAKDEAGPGLEQLRAPRWYCVALLHLRRILRIGSSGGHGALRRRRRRGPLLRMLILGHVAIAAVAGAVLLSVNSHSGAGCGRGQASHLAARFTGRAAFPELACTLSAGRTGR